MLIAITLEPSGRRARAKYIQPEHVHSIVKGRRMVIVPTSLPPLPESAPTPGGRHVHREPQPRLPPDARPLFSRAHRDPSPALPVAEQPAPVP